MGSRYFASRRTGLLLVWLLSSVTPCAVCVRVGACDRAKEGRAHFPLRCPQAPSVRIECAEGPGWLAGCRAGVGGQPDTDTSPHTGSGEQARELSAAKGWAAAKVSRKRATSLSHCSLDTL